MSLTFVCYTEKRTKDNRRYVRAYCDCGNYVEIQKCRFRIDRSCKKCTEGIKRLQGKGIYANKNQQIKELQEKIIELENIIKDLTSSGFKICPECFAVGVK